MDKAKQKQHDKMKKWFKVDKKADNHNRIAAVEVLKFLNGSQWDEQTKQKRKLKGRPVLQINVLAKYAKQIRGEWLKNCVQIKIRPVDSKADIKIAKIREGIIKNIEYLSDAESIYNANIDSLVACGYGAWRVRSRYTEEDEFLQELFIENIDNPLSVIWDADSRQPNYSDARRVWIYETMSKKDFEEKYPDAEIPGKESLSENTTGTADEHWYDSETVTVAECYYKTTTTKTICLLSDGQKMEKDAAEKFIEDIKFSNEQIKADQEKKRQESIAAGLEFTEQPVDDSGVPEIIKTREVETTKIKWVLMSGVEFIDEKDWNGPILPVVMVNGETRNIEGKKFIFGLYKDSLDPQRMLNYWHTAAAEFLALAPKAQWQATASMIEGYESRYADANTENDPVLLSNVDPDAAKIGWVKPERTQPPNVPQAIFAEIGRAEQNIKDCIGMYNVDVGDQGREISGRAIEARQVPGDTATYIYPKKMSKAIAWTGKILNETLNYYYDTARDARIRNIDDTESITPINANPVKVLNGVTENPERFSGVEKDDALKAYKNGKTFNDITQGKYDVIISTGPTFASQRVEAYEQMIKLETAAHVSPLGKYLIHKNSDAPGASEAAEIYKRMVPPAIIPPKAGEKPIPPMPPNPQQQIMMAKAQLELEKQKTEQIKLQVQIAKLKNELSQSKGGMDAAIISKLDELMSPVHPADNLG